MPHPGDQSSRQGVPFEIAESTALLAPLDSLSYRRMAERAAALAASTTVEAPPGPTPETGAAAPHPDAKPGIAPRGATPRHVAPQGATFANNSVERTNPARRTSPRALSPNQLTGARLLLAGYLIA